MHCITYTVLDVFWIDATWSWCLTAFILFMALYVSEVVGGVVTIRGSGTNPLASESKESGRFSEESLIQCWSTLATLPRITASHLRTLVELIRSRTSASIVGSWRMHHWSHHKEDGSRLHMLLPPPIVFLSCLSDLRRGPAERMYCSILLYICHLDSFRPLIDNTESRLQNPWLLGTYPRSKNLPWSRYESRLVLSPCVFEREIQREERNHARFSTWYWAQHVAYCPPCGGYVLEKRQPVPYPRGQPAPSPNKGVWWALWASPAGSGTQPRHQAVLLYLKYSWKLLLTLSMPCG